MTDRRRPDAVAGVRARLARVDWEAVAAGLDARGVATFPLLEPPECDAVAALWDDERRFRSTVEMARYRFGEGRYRYFGDPLPRLVGTLRTHAYPPLAAVANRWAAALSSDERFPPELAAFLTRCARAGQTKPTPLLLRYEAGGYNCLHQDLYGGVAFPLQLVCQLRRPGIDFEGGELLLVESRPRAQSRGEVVRLRQGEAAVFPNRLRPVAGVRAPYRVGVRHGVATVTRGVRLALGIIFHDAA